MTFDEFATIMAMYPTTPTDKLSMMFGIDAQVIKNVASACGVHKAGRRHDPSRIARSTIVTYNARTAEVKVTIARKFRLVRSRKPVKLQLKWEEL